MKVASPTVSDLVSAKVVTDSQVLVAVDAYLADPEADAYQIASGYVLNLKAAVRSQDWVWRIAREPAASLMLKRGSIRTAILLARTQKA